MDFNRVIEEISRVIKGKEEVVRKSLVCLLSGGHLLIEDIPGTGKTTLALALARVLGLSFSRIQFTSDLMPSDITGVNVFNPKTREFEFRKGPVFSNVVLADEINRATPKTQSALLEAMAEKQVSVDGKTYPLPDPFFVIATQNPVEHYGTYPLPEAQLDRFTMRLSLGYPSREDEAEIILGVNPQEKVGSLSVLSSSQELKEVMNEVKKVYVSREIALFISSLAYEIRNHPGVSLGLSTRGVLHLANTARALALVRERSFVVPEDVLDLLEDVVAHRIILREGVSFGKVLEDVLSSVRIP
ncbi:MAG: AAA domain-containing protein [Aquificae bacterium]|nr:AAA domain-containing protein [Aquificota bacterium]